MNKWAPEQLHKWGFRHPPGYAEQKEIIKNMTEDEEVRATLSAYFAFAAVRRLQWLRSQQSGVQRGSAGSPCTIPDGSARLKLTAAARISDSSYPQKQLKSTRGPHDHAGIEMGIVWKPWFDVIVRIHRAALVPSNFCSSSGGNNLCSA